MNIKEMPVRIIGTFHNRLKPSDVSIRQGSNTANAPLGAVCDIIHPYYNLL